MPITVTHCNVFALRTTHRSPSRGGSMSTNGTPCSATNVLDMLRIADDKDFLQSFELFMTFLIDSSVVRIAFRTSKLFASGIIGYFRLFAFAVSGVVDSTGYFLCDFPEPYTDGFGTGNESEGDNGCTGNGSEDEIGCTRDGWSTGCTFDESEGDNGDNGDTGAN